MILITRYVLMLALAIGVLVVVNVYSMPEWRHWLALTGVLLFGWLLATQVWRMRRSGR